MIYLYSLMLAESAEVVPILAEGEALNDLVAECGAGVALGIGLALGFWALGYAVWWVVDLLRGGAV